MIGLLSGTLAGVISTVLGHPLDTIKVFSSIYGKPDETISK